MKKLLQITSVFVLCLVSVFCMIGCDDTLTFKIDEKSYTATIFKDSSTTSQSVLDSSKIYLENSKGEKTSVKVDDCTLSTLDTSKLGKQDITITYGEYSLTIEVNVVEEERYKNYTITGFETPNFVTSYNSNKALENTYTATDSDGIKGFTTINATYLVGDDNPFIFTPKLQGVREGADEAEIITKYAISAKIYMLNGENYQELTDNISTYVAFDAVKNSFDFTETAIGKTFKIEVLPETLTEEEAELIETAVTFEFKVVDGYNVYNAADLSVIDNTNSEGKWTALKTANGIALDLNVNAIILHNNISIQDSDIPEIHFYKESEISENDVDSELTFEVEGEEIKVSAVGSLKDSTNETLGYIYNRQLKNSGDTFTIEGNYFTISIQDVSMIVRGNGQVRESIDNAITTHTSLFRFIGTNGVTDSSVNLNNIALFGNSNKGENAYYSGGMMCLKANTTNLTVDNCLSQSWFISFMTEGPFVSEESEVDIKTIYKNTNCFDAYNTILYVWGNRDVTIDNCVMIGAGGPVMICDHVDNNAETGAGGYPTNVNVKNSTLESWVAGTEGWFVTYGATTLVGSLKAIDQLLVGTAQSAGQTGYKSICDATGNKINLIAVYKSGSAEGFTTSVIRGTFDDYITGEDQTVMDLTDAGIATIKQNIYNQMVALYGANAANVLAQMVVLSTDNGTVGVPGTEGWIYPTSIDATFVQGLLTTEKYMSLYLFNGMSAVLGVRPATVSQA